MSNIIEQAKEFRKSLVKASQYAPDTVAVDNSYLYDEWNANGVKYAVGDKVRYVNALYKVLTAHTSQETWKPDNAPSLFKMIDEGHSGTKTDPIPAAVGLTYFKDKYYSEEQDIYLCIRNSEVPLYYMPSDLVGQYFEREV